MIGRLPCLVEPLLVRTTTPKSQFSLNLVARALTRMSDTHRSRMSVIHRAQNVGHLLDTMYGVRGPCTVLVEAVRYQGRMSKLGVLAIDWSREVFGFHFL